MNNRYAEAQDFFEDAFERKAKIAWMNAGYEMDDEEMDNLKDLLVELNFGALVIATGVPYLKPSYTQGIMPTVFRISKSKELTASNTFIFACDSALHEDGRFTKLMESLPSCHYTTVFPVREFKDAQ